MVLKNGVVFIDGKYHHVDVKVKDGVIVQVGEMLSDDEVVDVNGKYIFPGFIDTHIHGAMQHNCGESVESMKDICKYLPRFGVTSFVPTPVAKKTEEESALFIRNIREAMGCEGADILGIFLYSDYKNRSIAYYDPSPAVTKEHTLAMADGTLKGVRMMTIAPELPNGLEHIDWLVAQGVIPVIAFSEGTGDQISEAVAHGATLTDHFPNGFPVMDHHINMGTTQCLLEDNLFMQINCDCIHVAPNFIRMMLRVKGNDRFAAVSDSSSLLGCPEGEYQIGNKKVFLRDGAVRDINGKLVTGAHTYDENFRTMVKNGFDMETIGKLFSENAAKALRLTDRGKIEEGRRADLVVMDSDFFVEKTMILGKWVFEK